MDKEVVFIDTSVYIAENFFAPNNRINSLCDLAAKGVIGIVSTEITDNEVLQHFKEAVSVAWSNIKNNGNVLACYDETRKLLFKDTKKQWLKNCEVSFRKFKERVKVYTISYDYCDDVKSVFDKYFNVEKPFGEGRKKHEFPDAFVLQMLEHYCERNGLKHLVILSKDKDMKEYKSEHLIYKDYVSYITEKLTEADILEKIKKTIEEEENQLCSDIKDKLEDELLDTRYYYGLFNTEDSPDVEIINCKVERDNDFSVISKDGDGFLIELNFRSCCEVKCSYINLDYAIFDREDNKWYGGEWETETLTGEEDFRMIVRYDNETGLLHKESFKISDALPSFR